METDVILENNENRRHPRVLFIEDHLQSVAVLI